MPLSGLSAPLSMVSTQVKRESVSPEPIPTESPQEEQPEPTVVVDMCESNPKQQLEAATPVQSRTTSSSADSSPLSSPDPPTPAHPSETPSSRSEELRQQLSAVSAGEELKKPVPPSRLARAKRAAMPRCEEGVGGSSEVKEKGSG